MMVRSPAALLALVVGADGAHDDGGRGRRWHAHGGGEDAARGVAHALDHDVIEAQREGSQGNLGGDDDGDVAIALRGHGRVDAQLGRDVGDDEREDSLGLVAGGVGGNGLEGVGAVAEAGGGNVEGERRGLAGAGGDVVDAEGDGAHRPFSIDGGDLDGDGAGDDGTVLGSGEEHGRRRGVAGAGPVGGRQGIGQVGEEGLAAGAGSDGDEDGEGHVDERMGAHDHSACSA